MEAEVHIGEVHIGIYGALKVKGLEVFDYHGERMIGVDHLELSLGRISTKKNLLRLRKLKLEGVDFVLRKTGKDQPLNLSRFLRHFVSAAPPDTLQPSPAQPWFIECPDFELRNAHFVYEDRTRKKQNPKGIDFYDLELLDMDLLMHNVKLQGDTISAVINTLAFVEKSGFELKDFSGTASFSPVGLSVDNLLIHTNRSELDLDLKFSYDDPGAFRDFINSIRYDAKFGQTKIDMSDIGYFAPVMFSMADKVEIRGRFTGYVNNFRGRDFDLLYGENTHFSGDMRMNGLPDITETFIHADVDKFTVSADDIGKFLLPAGAGTVKLPDLLYKMGVIGIRGKFTGFYNDFVSFAEFNSQLGTLKTDITLKAAEGERKLAYSGRILGRELDIGKLFGMDPLLGTTNFSLEVDGSGVSLENLGLTLKGSLKSFNLKGYNYRNVRIDGRFAHKVFNGQLKVSDRNLDFAFLGLVDFNRKFPSFKFTSRIRNADLYRLKIAQRDSVSVFSADMNIDFTGVDIDSLNGNMVLKNISYKEGDRLYTMDTLVLQTYEDTAGINHLKLTSDWADAVFSGNYHISGLTASVRNYIARYSKVLAETVLPGRKKSSDQEIGFRIVLKDPDPLTGLFVPGLTVAPQTNFTGNFHAAADKFTLEATSSYLHFSNITVKDWQATAFSDDERFYFKTTGNKVYLVEPGEQDTTGIGIDSLSLHADLASDTVKYRIMWNDLSDLDRNKGDVSGLIALKDQMALDLKFTGVNISVDSALWSVDPANIVISDSSGVFFKDLMFYSDSSSFSINGGISHHQSDTLKMIFDEVNISHLDRLLPGGKVDVDGILNGEAGIVNLYRNPNFLINIELKDLVFNGQEFGLLKTKTIWKKNLGYLQVDLDVLRQGNIGTSEVLHVDGKYFPMSDVRNFDLNARLTNLNTHIFNPFITEFVDIDRESLASGNLTITGSYAMPVVTGKIDLMRTQFLIKYLNVLYSAGGSIVFGENFININKLILYDTRGRSASCTGNVYHDYFRDFNVDIVVDQDDFTALNTRSGDNDMFYGKAIVSGQVNIKGPLDDITMDIKAKTEKGTRIIIPINTSVDVAENDFIIFLNTVDTVKQRHQKYQVDLKGLTMNIDLEVTSYADIELYLPYNMGDIKGNGNGEIRMGVNPRGDFSIMGDYIIREGNFYFTLENLIGREFNIKDGSKISWAGSPYDATMDVTAVYPVKTTLAGLRLQTDSTSLYNTKVNVECVVSLKRDLFNPDIRFSIDFTNVADDIKQIIYAALDTTDQSAMSQQMLSLLVLGNFSYSSNAPNMGITGFKLLSRQLSDWLSKISKDFDIGINYQPGTKLTRDELEVALRTQLFNDRLSIDGNFGVRGTNDVENASNVVGDINIEYKIVEDGRFRIRAFNRTNDISLLEDNAPYTQGVGVFYRKEFEKFGDLFKPDKNKKKKRRRNKKEALKETKAVLPKDKNKPE